MTHTKIVQQYFCVIVSCLCICECVDNISFYTSVLLLTLYTQRPQRRSGPSASASSYNVSCCMVSGCDGVCMHCWTTLQKGDFDIRQMSVKKLILPNKLRLEYPQVYNENKYSDGIGGPSADMPKVSGSQRELALLAGLYGISIQLTKVMYTCFLQFLANISPTGLGPSTPRYSH